VKGTWPLSSSINFLSLTVDNSLVHNSPLPTSLYPLWTGGGGAPVALSPIMFLSNSCLTLNQYILAHSLLYCISITIIMLAEIFSTILWQSVVRADLGGPTLVYHGRAEGMVEASRLWLTLPSGLMTW
jgi:hypothetical protein